MVNRWFGVGQFLSGAMGQLYPGGDTGILGWGKATITRYENHQVQTRAHDNILRKIDSDPQWFLEMLNRVKGKISEKLFIRYFKAAYEQYRNSLNKSINSLYKSIEINTVVDILEILPGDTYTEICSRNSFKNRCRISSLWEYPADKSYKAEPLLSEYSRKVTGKPAKC